MAVKTATAAKGLQILQQLLSLYTTHDDASDNMVAGVYSHNPLEGSATEFDLVVSFLLFLQTYNGQFVNDIIVGQTYTIQSGASQVILGPLQVDGTVVVNGSILVL